MAGNKPPFSRLVWVLALCISLPISVLATPKWHTGKVKYVNNACAPYWHMSKSMVFILMAPSAPYKPITPILVHHFVYVILPIALNQYVPLVLKDKHTVWMVSVVLHVLQTWHLLVLVLVLLKFKFLYMLAKRDNVSIFPTLLLPTSLNKVQRHVLLILVYPLQLLHGMEPILQMWCGVNVQHLIMVS